MQLFIQPEWREILAHDHLDTFERLHSYRGEHCVSKHSRGATWRHTLSDGRVIFIKDGKIFHEITRGEDTRKQFFDKIIDVVTLLGGDMSDAL